MGLKYQAPPTREIEGVSNTSENAENECEWLEAEGAGHFDDVDPISEGARQIFNVDNPYKDDIDPVGEGSKA